MKKIFAVILALVLVCSLGAVAFAAGSPVKANPVEVYTGPALNEKEEDEGGIIICDMATDAVEDEVPAEEVTVVAVDDADSLEDADKEAFLAAYEAAKAVEGKAVVDFFWLDVPEQYTVDAENYLKFSFKCEGENVQVQVNGNEMEVVAEDEPNAYFAKLTELGAVAILCDAE